MRRSPASTARGSRAGSSLALVCDEETGGEGLEVAGARAAARSPPPWWASPPGSTCARASAGSCAPTSHETGRACHASRPWEGVNALEAAARDVLAIGRLSMPEEHPLLGRATLVPTMIAGGTKPNVLPGACDDHARRALDARVRQRPHGRDARRRACEGRVEVKSKRFQPVATPRDAEIVARRARARAPRAACAASAACRDLFHVRHVPGVVMGPGTSAASHAPDEWVAVEQVEAAVRRVRSHRRPATSGAGHPAVGRGGRVSGEDERGTVRGRQGGGLLRGRFEGEVHPALDAINRSFGVDRRLWREDIDGSRRPRARCSARCGILAPAAVRRIVAGLQEGPRASSRPARSSPKPTDEDVHMAVERRLTELIGPDGGRLHTAPQPQRPGRHRPAPPPAGACSRSCCPSVRGAAARARHARAPSTAARSSPPTRTSSAAQPVLFGHHLLAYVEMLDRDATRLAAASSDEFPWPLGAGAATGVSVPRSTASARRKALGGPGARPSREQPRRRSSSRDQLTQWVARRRAVRR